MLETDVADLIQAIMPHLGCQGQEVGNIPQFGTAISLRHYDKRIECLD